MKSVLTCAAIGFGVMVTLSATPAMAACDAMAIELTNTDGKASAGYVRIADDDALEPAALTIEIWFTPTGPGFGHTDDNIGACLISKPIEDVIGGFLTSYALFWRASDGVIAVEFAGDLQQEGALFFSDAGVAMNSTSHLTVTFADGISNLYIDGAFDTTFSTGVADIDYGDQDVLLGAINFGLEVSRRFQGQIHEVRIWDHARTQEQVQDNADCSLVGDEKGLVAYYTFDESTLTDGTANGNDGVAAGLVDFVDSDVAGNCCPEDLSSDGTVDTIDLLALLGAWGDCKACPEDLNCDGTVDTIDLLALLGAWGPCS